MNDSAIASEIGRLIHHERYGPVSEGDVAAAERELGLVFPRSYRIFLLNYGAGSCKYWIYGLPDTRNFDAEQPDWYHVVDASQSMWSVPGGNGMDRHLIYITSNEGGINYYLDTSATDADGDCPVVAWGPEAPGNVVGATFLEFLRNLRTTEDDPV